MTNEELAAVAALWKRTGRRLVTEFTGTSMLPAIADGASVELICIDDVWIGDVIAYVYGDRVIVHRIVAQWGDRFVARGDANFLPDARLVERNDIIGKLANPPAARHSPLASAFLALVGIFGTRAAVKIVGLIRSTHRRIRPRR